MADRARHPMVALADDIDFVHDCWDRWSTPGVVVDEQYRAEKARVDVITASWRATYRGLVLPSPVGVTLDRAMASALRHLAVVYAQ